MTITDWLTAALALGTFVMAVATVGLGLQTKRAADETAKAARAGQQEADASLALVQETRRDRELEIQPVLVLADERKASGQMLSVRIRNVGRGPAMQLRVFERQGNAMYWNSGPGITVGPGETEPTNALDGTPTFLGLTSDHGAVGVSSFVLGPKPNAAVAYCIDQLGNRLRFDLDAGGPPDMWPREAEPPKWADAWDL